MGQVTFVACHYDLTDGKVWLDRDVVLRVLPPFRTPRILMASTGVYSWTPRRARDWAGTRC